MRLSGGAGKFEYATGNSTATAASGTPEYVIDGTAFGAMQADRIKIVVNEKGAGVRMRTDMAANVGELTLSADGKISLNNASGKTGVTINAKAGVEAKKLTSKKKVDISAAEGIVLQSIAAAEDIVLAGGSGLISVSEGLASLGAVAVAATGTISTGSVDAGRKATLTSTSGAITIAAAAKSSADLILTATSGAIAAGSLVSAGQIRLTAGREIGISGDLLAAGNLTATGASIRAGSVIAGIDLGKSQGGTPVLSGTAALTLKATAGPVEATTLLAAGNLSVTAASLKAASVTNHGTTVIAADTDIGQLLGASSVTLSGRNHKITTLASGVDFAATEAAKGAIKLGSTGDLTIAATSGSVTAGTILSAGRFTSASANFTADSVTGQDDIALVGSVDIDQLLSGRHVALSGGKVEAGTVIAGVDLAKTATRGGNIVLGTAGNLTIDAKSASVDAGSLLSAGNLSVSGFSLTAGSVMGHGAITIAAETKAGQLLGAGSVTLSGRSHSVGTLASGVDFAATEAANGAIKLGAARDLVITATSGSVTAGTILSAGKLTGTSGTFTATSVTGQSDIALTGNVAVSGALLGGRHVTLSGGKVTAGTVIAGIDLAKTAANGGNAVLGTTGNLVINGSSFAVDAGSLLSAGNLSVTSANLKAASVTSHGAAAITADADVGQILGAGAVTLAGHNHTVGTLASGVDFAATQAAKGAIKLKSAGDLAVTASSGSVTAGTIVSAGAIGATTGTFTAASVTGHGAVTLNGTTNVSGALLAGGDLSITGASINAGTLVSGVDFARTETAGGAIVLGDAGTMTLKATAGPIEAATLLAAGNLAASSANLKATNITGHGDIALNGNAEISGQLLGARHVTLSGSSIRAGTIVSGLDFAATQAGGGPIRLGSNGDLTITASSGTVTAGTLLSAGKIGADTGTFTAASVTGHGAVAIAGTTKITGALLAGGDLSITGQSIRAGTLVSGVDFVRTEAAGSIVAGSSGTMTLTATAGPIEATTLLAAGNLTASSANFNAANVTGHGDIALNGNAEISGQLLGGRHVTFAGKSITLANVASGVDFAATQSARGAIKLGSTGDLTITATSGSVIAGTILSAGKLTGTTGTFTAGNVSSHGAASIAGDTTISGALLAAVNVNITGQSINADTLVSGVDFAKTEAAGSVVLGSGGAMTLKATAGNVTARQLLSAGNLGATASGDITANAVGHGALALNAGNTITLSGQSLSGTAMTLKGRSITAGTLVSGVDFTATSGSGSLLVRNDGAGTMTLSATAGAIEASSLVSGGDLSASTSSDIGYGSLQSFADAALTATTGTISLDKTTAARGDIAVRATSVDLSNNRGRIATSGTLAIIANSADFSGSRYAFGGLDLDLSGSADLTGATLAAITNSSAGGSGDIAIKARTIDTNAATALLAGNDLMLDLATLANAGQLAAGRDLALNVAGGLTNGPTGLLYAGNDLGLFSTTLTNDQGAILAGNDLVMARNATGARNSGITNISGLIEVGGDASIATAKLINRRTANPSFTANVLVSSGPVAGFELNPDVAGLPFAHLLTDDYDPRELYDGYGGQLWADYEPHLWSGAVLADGGSYRAWTWTSAEGPSEAGPIYNWIYARVPKDADGNPVLDPNNPSRYFIVQQIHHGGTDTSTTYSWDGTANIAQTVHQDRLDDAGGPQALIRAGGKLAIDATTLTNSYSAIETRGDMELRGDRLVNEGLVLTRTTTTECHARGACEYYDADGNRDPSKDIANGTAIISKIKAIGSEGGTIRAGGALGIGYGAIDNRAAEGSVAGGVAVAPEGSSADPLAALAGLTAGAALFTPNAALQTIAAAGGLTAGGNPEAAPGATVSGTAPVAGGNGTVSGSGPVSGGNGTVSGSGPVAGGNGTVTPQQRLDGEALAARSKPQSGGFGGTVPGQVFLFEPRAQFLDVGKFYGSGYFIDRIGYKPDWQVPFLGDAYFENRLIEQQLRQATGYGLGQNAILPGADAVAEMKALLDRGADYAKAHGLTIGQKLTPQQIAALDASIVLYETVVVDGVKVLAPVLYLASADKAKLTAAGALIAGNSVRVEAGSLNNSGAFASAGDLLIQANEIKTTGGGFLAGGNLELAAGNLTLTAQTLDIGGQTMVNPTAAVVAGGNAVLSATHALTLQGARVEAGGNAALLGKGVTLDVVKVENNGQQNATGASVNAGGNVLIHAETDITLIGSAARGGGDLQVSAESGSVSLVTADVARKTDDGYRKTVATEQQGSQLVSGGSTAVKAGDDILISGSDIRAGADVALSAGDDIAITTAEEQRNQKFGDHRASATTHEGSAIEAGGSVGVVAGTKAGQNEGGQDGDLAVIGSNISAGETVGLTASGGVTIAEAQDSATLDTRYSSKSGGLFKKKTSGTGYLETTTSVGSLISGDGGVAIASDGDTVISASSVTAGTAERSADIAIDAGGNLAIASGKDTTEVHDRSKTKGFLKKGSTSYDSYDETTVASELSASGNVSLNADGAVAISGSDVAAGESIAIEGDSVSILGAAEEHEVDSEKKKSGLFAGSGDGFISLWGKEGKASEQSATVNVGSSLSAGDNVTITARDSDVNIVGSGIAAGNDIALDAARDVNILPGKESFASEESEKRSGFGIAYSSGNGSASIGIGYGKAKDEVSQSASTNAVSTLSAGNDIVISAGRDANLQAAKVEAERDVAITAARDVNLLSAQDVSNYKEVHEQLFAGVTLSVSTSLVSAADSVGNLAEKVGNISDGYSAANAAFASLKAYDALDNIVRGNIVSGSLTVGFNYSKDTVSGTSSVPVTTDIRAGRSVTIEATSGDITGHGVQIAAGYDEYGLPVASGDDKAGDISLKAGNDIVLKSAEASKSSSSKSVSGGADFGIGGGIGLTSSGFGLTGGAHAGYGKSKGDGTTQVNSHITGTGDITIQSGNDTTLAGALVSGETVKAEVDGDLTIVSVPDSGEVSDKSVSGGLSLGGSGISGIQAGGGSGSGSTNWIEEQSGLVSQGKMDVTVGGNTHLGAGKIVSESGELTLETETLTYEDFEGHKEYEGFNADLGLDLTGGKGTATDPVGNSTLEGSYRLDDTRQTVRATVGPGEITIRDEQKQAALEKDGATAPLDELNRDPDKAYEITRDKHVEVEFYLSTNSLNALGEGLKDMAAPGGFIDRYLLGRELTVEETAQVKAGVEALANGGSFAGCGQKQGFNLFNWIVTPAYAYETECTIRQADGSFIKLGIKTYEECQDAIYAYLNSLSYDERVAVLKSAGFASGAGLGGETSIGESVLLSNYLFTAIDKLDGQPRGENFLAFLSGVSEGQEFLIGIGPKNRAIWSDPTLSLAEKMAASEEIGLDSNVIVAMAILSGVAKTSGLVTSAKFGDSAKLQDHYVRHGGDFGARSELEYQAQASRFLVGSKPSGTLEKIRANGDVVRYNPATDEFGVISSAGVIRTYYKPDPAVHGKGTNLDYFNGQ